MKSARVYLLILMTALGARSLFALTANANVAPASAVPGQVVTVTLQITNSSGNPVTSITPYLNVASGSASLLSGPNPASMALAPGQPGDFIYSFSITGCGFLSFSGSASGYESPSTVVSNDCSTILFDTCPVTPTATPTPTSGPVVIGPTLVPGIADARVLGNKLHVGSGQTVGFKVTLPFGGAIRIHIYNRQGQKVKSIEREGVAGDNTESWDGRGEQGAFVGAGIYAVQFQGKGLNKVAKIVVIK